MVDVSAVAGCPTPDNQCEVAICDVETGGCGTAFLEPGTPCDDDDFCTVGDFCYDGECLSYDAENAVGDPICPQNCLPSSAAMGCGDFESFDLAAPFGSSLLEAYNCGGAEGYTGRETAFLLTPPNQAYEMPLTLALELADPGLKGLAYADIVVLKATDDYQCWPDKCVDVGYMDDNGVATLEIPAFVDSDGVASNDTQYIVVIDGRDGFDGAVRLASWCAPGYTGIELYCTDGVDDDTDGITDCEDSSCWDSDLCLFEHDCDNGKDDDEDGAVDCADDDCDGHPDCFVETNCADGLDDEGDGLTDCEDDDCASAPACGDVCEGAIPLSCGDVLTGQDPLTGSKTFTNFPCSPSGVGNPSVTYDNPHHVYHVNADDGCGVLVRVTPNDTWGVMDVFALAPGCATEQCVEEPGNAAGCVNPQTPSSAFFAPACVQVPEEYGTSSWVAVMPDNDMVAWGIDVSYTIEVICDCD